MPVNSSVHPSAKPCTGTSSLIPPANHGKRTAYAPRYIHVLSVFRSCSLPPKRLCRIANPGFESPFGRTPTIFGSHASTASSGNDSPFVVYESCGRSPEQRTTDRPSPSSAKGVLLVGPPGTGKPGVGCSNGSDSRKRLQSGLRPSLAQGLPVAVGSLVRQRRVLRRHAARLCSRETRLHGRRSCRERHDADGGVPWRHALSTVRGQRSGGPSASHLM
jgi:hypothetical protein